MENTALKCTNCHFSNQKLLYEFFDEIDSFYDKKKRLMRVYQCRNCSLIYAKVHQPKEEKNKLDEIFFKETHLHEEGESRTIRNFDEVLNKIKKYGGYGRLLDVGCGTGYFLKFAQDRDWEVKGVEIAKNAAQHAKNLGLKVKNASLEKSHFKKAYFTSITQLGVIEHVGNPRKLLKESNRILKKGGVLVIFTPNANSLFHKLAHIYYKLTSSYFAIKKIYYPRHTFYFTKKTLSDILRKEGFVIKEIQPVSLDINKQFFLLFEKQKWARNPLLKLSGYTILALTKLTRTETHMLVYAIKK